MSSTNWSGWSKVSRTGLDATTQLFIDPVVIRNKDGNRDLFCLGEGGLWHLPEKGIWARLGSPPAGFNGKTGVGVGKNLDGRLEVFALGVSPLGQLWHIWQLTPGGAWSQWGVLDLGAPQGGFREHSNEPDSVLAVGQNQDGRLEVFTLGDLDRNLWQIWQTAPNNGWSHWKSTATLGNVSFDHITVGRNLDGRQEVFVRLNSEAGIAHIWQTAPNNGWSQWKSEGLSGDGRFRVGRNQDGRLQIFVIGGPQGVLLSMWQTAPNNGWSQWNTIVDRPSGDVFLGQNLAVVQNIDGRWEVFAADFTTDGTMWHVWQTTPNGGWSAWHNFGKPAGADWVRSPHFFDVDRHQDGKLEVFAIAGDEVSNFGNLWHAREL